ncbi:MAG: efflux transporter periplasmic adaptor subunit, partial [Rhodobacteraceae bacterium]|nr:efflux transporter periplasmic adaptor subunit [Paracoccaceae bacterium]
MRFLRQSLIGVFLTGLTLALLIYAGQIVMGAVQARIAQEDRAAPPRERVFAVNVVPANLETVTPILEAFGQVQSRRTLELRATTTGRIVWLSEDFVEGGVVQDGEALVRIDPADAQAALERTASDLLDAEAEVRDADRLRLLATDELRAAEDQATLRERAYRRQQDLARRGVGMAVAVEDAEIALASARQSVLARRISEAQAEARVDQAMTRLVRARIALADAERDVADTNILAGFSGTLSEVTLVEGRLVATNEKLALLVDLQSLEVVFRVSVAQYTKLLDDFGRLITAPVIATLDAAGNSLEASGVISRDAAVAGEGQSGRLIFAQLDTAPGFKPEDFVTIY